MVARGTRWCFTLNGFTDEDVRALIDSTTSVDCPYRFIIVGRELGESGNRHLQGYFELRNRLYLTQCKALGGLLRAHFEIARGDAASNVTYCSKEGDIALQFGVPANRGSSAGGKANAERIADAYESALTGSLDGIAPDVLLRYYNTLAAIASRALWTQARNCIPDVPLVLFRWQSELLDFLRQPPSARAIYFVCDAIGGVGKSTFSKYLRRSIDNCVVLQPAKGQDLGFILERPPSVVVFDVPRCAIEHVPWAFVESVKNGYVVSTKYQGVIKEFPCPHVCVFCNEMPAVGILSVDRVVSINPKCFY